MVQDVFIYGEIGKQVTLDTVLDKITPKATGYTVHIISNGGDVFEGYAIYNALKNTGKEITVFIEGVCASIATLIASVAPKGKILMNDKAQFMIHNPRVSNTSGDSKDLRNVAGQLDRIKAQLIDSWVGRTTLSREQLSEMYDNETWLTPEQAETFGFVDEVRPILKAVATADIKKFKYMEDKKTILGAIENLTKKVMNLFSAEVTPVQNATLTLADGTQIQAPDDDWAGKPVTSADGTALAPGAYTLESGGTFTIDENGNATSSPVEPEAKTEDEPKNEDDMKLKEENEALKAKVLELQSALEARNSAAEKAEAKAKTFENKLNVDLKKVHEELATLKNTTVGDQTPPDKGIKNTFQPEAAAMVADPMKKFFGDTIIEPRK